MILNYGVKMKQKLLTFTTSVLLIILIVACSKPNDELTTRYWIKYKKGKPNFLVKFNKDGRYINFNKLNEVYKWEIIQNRLIITNSLGVKQKFFIKSLTNKELKLSEISEIGETNIDLFKVAKEKDFFLGNWIKINKGNNYRLTFEYDSKAIIEEEVNEYIATKPISYIVKDNIITLNNDDYRYKFSDDLMELELISANNEKIILTRMK